MGEGRRIATSAQTQYELHLVEQELGQNIGETVPSRLAQVPQGASGVLGRANLRTLDLRVLGEAA